MTDWNQWFSQPGTDMIPRQTVWLAGSPLQVTKLQLKMLIWLLDAAKQYVPPDLRREAEQVWVDD